MSVTPIDRSTLDRTRDRPLDGQPRVALSTMLTDAFAAALASPTERAAVFDGDRYAGDFTATSLLESLRRAGGSQGEDGAAV